MEVKALGVGFIDCFEGMEEAFNRWYDTDHLPEHISLPAAVGGPRYVPTPHCKARRPPPPELTADERRAAEERLALRLQRTGITMRDLPFGVPARKTPLSFLHFDRLGGLWVEVSVAAGEHRRADVYNRAGELVHEVEWPADVNLILGQMDSATALGISRDSLGVERIVGLRFRR